MSISNPAWWAIIAVGWVAAVGPGDMEGLLKPAVSPLEITAQRQEKEGVVSFDGETFRLRAECNFVSVEWFIGARSGSHVPTSVWPEPPRLRPETGKIELTRWSVYTSDQGLENTFADVFHECRLAGVETPWLVRTEFFN